MVNQWPVAHTADRTNGPSKWNTGQITDNRLTLNI